MKGLAGVASAALLLWVGAANAEEARVFFLGFARGGGPSFESRLARLLRERLHGTEGVRLAGISETAVLKKRMNQSNFERSSRAAMDLVAERTREDDMMVWARVRSYSMTPERKMVFGTRVVGTVTVGLWVYYPRARRYLFVGKVSAEASVRKPPAWFRRVSLVTHITAEDRSRITGELVRMTANKAGGALRAVVRHYFEAKAEGIPMNAEVEVPIGVSVEGEEPMLRDLFSIPMSEPAAVSSQEAQEGAGGPGASELNGPAGNRNNVNEGERDAGAPEAEQGDDAAERLFDNLMP
ncbi:MAG: hypothetical protein GF344_15430 [Chitinivibrionales bacterium]|nr:hypothetical protein [Chitinivibrionales bacterium]MBD3358096.1 hypothetical protein [Chitinivibrionales bacterium]